MANTNNRFFKELPASFENYLSHFPILVETTRYQLKVANKSDELIQLFKLRHQIFFSKQYLDNTEVELLEIDDFDLKCDHIIITCLETKRIVGTYRILCDLFTEKFYSEGEFKLDQFIAIDGIKMELGRACIDNEHRNGHVIDLLWNGIAQYIQQSKARYMFGCSSIMITEAEKVSGLIQYLKDQDYSSEQYQIEARDHYKMDLSHNTKQFNADELLTYKKMIPPLLRSYLNAGARVFGGPALDKEFECVDFFTIIDLQQLNPLFKKRYLKI